MTEATRDGSFNRTLSVLGALFSGLSVFALIASAWTDGLAQPIELIVGYYNSCLNLLLGWAEPLLRALADALRAWTGFDLHLHAHWKTSVVAYGILVGAGLSALAERMFAPALHAPMRVLCGAAGVAVGIVDALLQRDVEPGEAFYGLWQVFGSSYLLVITFAFAAMLALGGIVFRHGERSFVGPADAERLWAAGSRTLYVYAGALVWVLTNAGSKLIGL
jgi:hypothetical protein